MYFASAVFTTASSTTTTAAHFKTLTSSFSSSVLPISALFVFRNIFNQELIRSVHVYQIKGGEEKWIYREFLFSPSSCEEIRALNLGRLHSPPGLVSPRRLRFQVGQPLGLWICVLAFDPTMNSSTSYSIPSILCPSRNSRLKFVPNLLDDLEKVFQMMMLQTEPQSSYYSTAQGAPYNCQHEHSSNSLSNDKEAFYEVSSRKSCSEMNQSAPSNQQIENDFPVSEEMIEEYSESMRSKKRAEKEERVSSITLSGICKHFNVPISEAAKRMKVGETILKRKCREFGIPRWPFRKLKSLETLIHDLQEEVQRQERENKPLAARKAVEKRKKILEAEKEEIEKFPFMELQKETKRFRQDVFKRRCRAKGKKKSNAAGSN